MRCSRRGCGAIDAILKTKKKLLFHTGSAECGLCSGESEALEVPHKSIGVSMKTLSGDCVGDPQNANYSLKEV